MKNILDSQTYIYDLKNSLSTLDISELKNKSILITGGLGLIGAAIVDLLYISNEVNNTNITIYIGDINSELFNDRYGDRLNINYVNYDVMDTIDFKVKFDYVIHGAGIANPNLYVEKPVETILSNFNGALNLLNYCKKNNSKRLLYISSSEVYGNKQTDEPFIESNFGNVDINNIRSSYPEAKRATEILCKSYSSEYGVDTVIVRPGHIFGPTASPKDTRISSNFMFLASQGKNLEMKSSGIQKRSYCYSVDCANAILTVLINGKTGESYNVGTMEVTSIRDMAQYVANSSGVSLKLIEPSEKEINIFNPMNNSSLNVEKLYSIGFVNSFDVFTGIKNTIKILKDVY